MTSTDLAQRVAEVRAFNRFYTLRMGWLRRGFLKSPFSLTEARVLYELAHRDRPHATDIAKELDLDAGYLSRILRRFVQGGLLKRTPSRTDGRQRHLLLTKTGRQALAVLERASRAEAGIMLGAIDPDGQSRLTAAMGTIQRILAADQTRPESFMLRPHRVGDMGWIVHRQAVLYAREYGWNEQFEGFVAGIAGKFIETFDPARECCWIAEREGAIVGSVFVVQHSKTEARLRMLYVEPAARGLGVGRRLTEEAIRFARDRGYQSLKLWTNDILVSARRIYEGAGFRLVEEERHHSFGHDLVGQTWVLNL